MFVCIINVSVLMQKAWFSIENYFMIFEINAKLFKFLVKNHFSIEIRKKG